MYCNKSEILKNIRLNDEIYEMIILDKEISNKAEAGQFIHIKPYGTDYPLLRRPISINRINRQNGAIAILYQLKGKGTIELSRLESGDFLDVMGPLGNGFPIKNNKRCAVVGGGIGTAPLLELAAQLENCDAYLGFRSDIYKIDAFEKVSKEVYIATEDGSAGIKGFVTDLLAGNLHKYDVIYTCGPKIMMKKVKELCKENNTECYLSLEERMGCGIGACLVCVCKTKADNEAGWHHSKVCSDGPVFNSEEVVFDV
ncbi:MAG: dihydroorotate dehydrogenase electron transfer subunit [Bacillota bacterium]